MKVLPIRLPVVWGALAVGMSGAWLLAALYLPMGIAPDERYITWVATTIEFPANWRATLNPTQSGLNPFYWPPDAASEGIVVLQDEHRDFAYGHLPLYLGVAATRLVERIGPALTSFSLMTRPGVDRIL